MTEETTTIQVTNETWQELNARKAGPNDSFNDVIQRLLENDED